ncbi:hypothetical protein R6Q59_023692 [Mikania micrantha]
MKTKPFEYAYQGKIRLHVAMTRASDGTGRRASHLLTMALPKEIFQSIKSHKRSKALWDALAKRCEGNDQLKRSKRTLLKKHLEVFKCLDNETFDELITRYTFAAV